MRKTLFLLPFATLIGLVGCGQPTTTHETQTSTASDVAEVKYTSPTPVKVQRRDIVGYEFLNGDLVAPPEAQAVVYSAYQTPVEQVMTSIGQHVRKGEVLVKLSSPQAQVDYEQARAAVKSAEVALNTARAQAEAPVRQLRSQLTEARSRERQLRQSTDPSGDATDLANATAER
jgi:multidrug efflux pump subunit AcrA (membrane-fusion protein)